MNAPETDTGWETARLHVQWQGQEHLVSVRFRTGEATLLDLVPVAHELASQTTAVGIDQAQAEGRRVSCCAGCGACCRQLVAIPVVEALALAELVAALPAKRQAVIRERFAAAIRRLEEAGLLDPQEPRGQRALCARDLGNRQMTLWDLARRYFRLGIACPFLESESCSIHPERPTVCREHHVTSPAENCSRLYEAQVDRLEPPLRISEALARATARLADVEQAMIPLVLSLECADALRDSLGQNGDGLSMLQTLVGEIDERFSRPFGQRDEDSP